jgi:hypothetical protein
VVEHRAEEAAVPLAHGQVGALAQVAEALAQVRPQRGADQVTA